MNTFWIIVLLIVWVFAIYLFVRWLVKLENRVVRLETYMHVQAKVLQKGSVSDIPAKRREEIGEDKLERLCK